MLKGNLLVGQSGGPSPVINASLAGVISAAQRKPEVSGIYGLVHGIEGALKEELFDLKQESPGALKLLRSTPASILGSCRHKIKNHEYERILEVFRAHNVRHFVYIGGNDSMDTCQKISDLAASTGYEMQVMGVPKTIDNDLAYTDHTPGFGSAARFIALAARDTGRDMEAMSTFEDITILETMGRNAGWLAGAAALGRQDERDAPHLVYFPELAFEEERFIEDLLTVHSRQGFVFAAISEGLRYANGEFVGSQVMNQTSDAFGHRLNTLTTGVAAYLSELAAKRTGLRARFLRPVLIGRAFSACVAEVDRREAFAVGEGAVEQLALGESGYMITLERVSTSLYQVELGRVELDKAANAEKLTPREFINETGNGITPAFMEYALPLIDGPLPPLARLQGVYLPKKTY